MTQNLVDSMWIVWLVIAAICAAVEVLTTGFIAIWFGLAAGAAALAAAVGFGLPFQLVVFLVVATTLTASTRRIFLRWLNKPVSTLPALNDLSLVGKRGIIITESRGPRREAEIDLDGTVWTALPIHGETLSSGVECEVIQIEGNQLYVRPVHYSPDWKTAQTGRSPHR